MYPIDNTTLQRFKDAYPQKVRITMGDTVLTEEDIVQGGLSVNRYCASGDMIELGSAIAAEANIVLNNTDGRFDNTTFGGQEMFIEVGVNIADEGEEEDIDYIPFGYFTPDVAPRKLAQITISALDRMMLFEKKVNLEAMITPRSVALLFGDICDICDVTLATDVSTLPNANLIVEEITKVQTYRDILTCLCEITGTCAYMNEDGELVVSWFESANETIELEDRYTSDLYESSLTVTGIQVLVGETIYAAGTEGYVLTIADNPFVGQNGQIIADQLLTALGGFTYTPFSATTLTLPHLYPLDVITFVDKNDNDVSVAITDWTFHINSRTEMKGRGKTEQQIGYGRSYQYTREEASLIDKVSSMDKMGLYDFRNSGAITIPEDQRRLISYLRLVTNEVSATQISIEVNLEATDTDSDGLTLAICNYMINDDEVTSVYPTETYIDGKHVLHLMYVLHLEKNEICYFSLYMRSESGTITIEPNAVLTFASGTNLVVDEKWNGRLFVSETAFNLTADTPITVTTATESISITRLVPIGGTFTDTATDLTALEIAYTEELEERVRVVNYEDECPRVTEDEEDVRVTEDGDTRYTEKEHE